MSKSVMRLFEQFKPEQYELILDLDYDKGVFSGHVIIKGQKTGRPSKRVTFHQKGLAVSEAAITRHDKKGDQDLSILRINHHRSFDEVRLHTEAMAYPGNYTVTMHFTGKIQDNMHGIYRSKYKVDGKDKTLVSTQFESHHAREAFPCIDEPEAKATFCLTLVNPAGDTAISNMPVKNSHEDNGKLTTLFESSPRMSTYLLAFVAGDMQYRKTKTKDGVDVRVWATKAHSPESLDYALDVNKKGIEFFNDYYGVPYPLPKLDSVAIPDFSSAAMENWGIVTYREIVLLIDPKTASQSNRETVSLVSLHELSHQWFGNLVTMKWWDDLWLNESFANVMEYVSTHAINPQWHVWDTFVSMEGLSSLRRDSIAGVQAVKTPVNHPDEISSLFDPSIVYAKGGRLLNMLMNYLGEDVFRSGLKTYFTKHAYKNTTGDDLWEALSLASGKNVKAFMEPWLSRSGYPVVDVIQKGDNLTIRQRHFTLDASKSDTERIWPVPTLCDDHRVPSLFDVAEISLSLPTEQYIRINQGAIGHYIVNYTEAKHLNHIAGCVKNKQLNEAERLMLISDSSMLARGGIQSFARTLELLQFYEKESSEPVWDIITVILSDLKRFIDSNLALEDNIKRLVIKLIESEFDRLGWEEKAGEPVQDTKLRATIIGLGVYAGHKKIVAQALELFESYKTDSAKVPAELRSIVFGAAVREDAKGAFEYLLELEESTDNVNLKQDLLGALTTTKSTALADRLLKRLKDSAKVRLHDVDYWLVNLMRSRHTQEQAWSWLRSNWDWIEKTFSDDKSYDYFPRYAASALNTPARLKEYEAFFTPYKDHLSLGRNVVMGIEELATRVAWIARDGNDVKKFLDTI